VESEIKGLEIKGLEIKGLEIKKFQSTYGFTIKTLTRDLLISQSAFNSRDIYEFVLNRIFEELNPKGNCNPKSACDKVVK
jgi:hypothetical protein